LETETKIISNSVSTYAEKTNFELPNMVELSSKVLL